MKGFLATLLALVCFLATHALIGRALAARPELRLLPDSVEAQKYREFHAHADEYDVVYVGTSRVLRGFDPATFGETLRGLGQPLRAYNFGLVGMGYLEERFAIEWILAQHPAKLRCVLIEPTERSAPWVARPILLDRANLFNLRDVLWHTPSLTLAAIRAAWRSDRDLWQKLKFARAHLLHGAHRLCNVGVGASLLARVFAPVAPAPLLPDGFEGRDKTPESGEIVLPDAPAREPDKLEAAYPWRVISGVAETAHAAGVATRFVIPATSKSLAPYQRARDAGELPDLLVYPLASLPEIAADQSAYFYDAEHLNLQGAAVFSRRLALDLAPLLARAP